MLRLITGLAVLCLALSPVSAEDIRRVSYGVTGSLWASGTRPEVSNDGRYVVFTSYATNLVPDDLRHDQDVFLFDRVLQITKRISISSCGEDVPDDVCWDFNDAPTISGDGRVVAFTSYRYDENSNTFIGENILVHDLVSGETTLVDRSSSGEIADSDSRYPQLSYDGRIVAFWSRASNLVANDTNGNWDIFVHDRDTGTTSRIPLDEPSTPGNQILDISADGNVLTFSTAGDLIEAGDTNGVSDVYVYEVDSAELTLVSTAFDGAQTTLGSGGSTISNDGRFVAFQSRDHRIVPEGSNGRTQIYVRDRVTSATYLVSKSTDGNLANGAVDRVQISGDGTHVVFNCSADNLVASDLNNVSDVFIHRIADGVTSLVSLGEDGSQADNHSEFPSVNGDGSVVVFVSLANNIVEAAYGYYDHEEWQYPGAVFARVLDDQRNEIISTPVDPAEPQSETARPAMDSEGRFIVFRADEDIYLPDFENQTADVYLYGVEDGSYQLIRSPLSESKSVGYPTISADGAKIAYLSWTGCGDVPCVYSLNVYDVTADSYLVEVLDQGSCDDLISMSSNGRYVLFSCRMDEVIASEPYGFSGVFLKDLEDGTVQLVSRGLDGTPANGNSFLGNVSSDGRWVSFSSDASNLIESDTNEFRDVFLADMENGRVLRIGNTALGEPDDRSGSSIVSADGSFVVFSSAASNLVAYHSHSDLYRYDLATTEIVPLGTAYEGPIQFSGLGSLSLTHNDRYLFFYYSFSNLVENDSNGYRDVFVLDLHDGQVKMVSVLEDGTQGNNLSYYATGNNDISVIAFDTLATSFGYSDTNRKRDIYLKLLAPADGDHDGVIDESDNCPLLPNPNQLDSDGDEIGDICDPDDDGDGIEDSIDNCPLTVNADQKDLDGDGVGDECDTDLDGDGVVDGYDSCRFTSIGDPVDLSGCSVSDVCPCTLADGGTDWRNNGLYTRCVAHQAMKLLRLSRIEQPIYASYVKEAAQATCGKY